MNPIRIEPPAPLYSIIHPFVAAFYGVKDGDVFEGAIIKVVDRPPSYAP